MVVSVGANADSGEGESIRGGAASASPAIWPCMFRRRQSGRRQSGHARFARFWRDRSARRASRRDSRLAPYAHRSKHMPSLPMTIDAEVVERGLGRRLGPPLRGTRTCMANLSGRRSRVRARARTAGAADKNVHGQIGPSCGGQERAWPDWAVARLGRQELAGRAKCSATTSRHRSSKLSTSPTKLSRSAARRAFSIDTRLLQRVCRSSSIAVDSVTP